MPLLYLLFTNASSGAQWERLTRLLHVLTIRIEPTFGLESEWIVEVFFVMSDGPRTRIYFDLLWYSDISYDTVCDAHTFDHAERFSKEKEEKEWLKSLHLVECRRHWLLSHWKDEEIPGTLVGRFALTLRYMHVSKATAGQKLHQSGSLKHIVSEFRPWPFDKFRGFVVDNR